MAVIQMFGFPRIFTLRNCNIEYWYQEVTPLEYRTILNGIITTVKESQEKPPSLSAMWVYNEHMNQEAGSGQTPNLLMNS